MKIKSRSSVFFTLVVCFIKMSSVGNFEVVNLEAFMETPNSSPNISLSDSDNEVLMNILLPNVMLEEANEEDLGYLAGVPSTTETNDCESRFKKVTDADLKKYEEMTQSKSTKKNTKWGLKIFQDWHTECFKTKLDMTTVTKENLAEKLGRFYCEARPKSGETTPTPHEYHKNSMKNIRAAINRHIQDIDREMDIVNGIKFKRANKLLDGLLKERLSSGLSKPTQHKEIVEEGDLQ